MSSVNPSFSELASLCRTEGLLSQISRDRKFLSILADVATQSEELKNSKFFSINVDDSHPVDLKTSSLEEVKYLIEIVFHVSTRDFTNF